MGLTRVAAPMGLPVTLDEAKRHCRVTNSASDTVLQRLVEAATTYIEEYIERSLAHQTWKLSLDCFSDAIRLLRGPVSEITSFQYVDADGALTDVPEALYTLDTESDPAWIVRNSDEAWPDTLDAVNVVQVTYTAGCAPVPEDLKHAILLLVGHWFDEREGAEFPMAIHMLCVPHRNHWFGA